MSHTVKRTDFVKRSRVFLSCTECGTTTTHCDIEDADIYEAGYNDHVCTLSQVREHPSFVRMLGHIAGGVL